MPAGIAFNHIIRRYQYPHDYKRPLGPFKCSLPHTRLKFPFAQYIISWEYYYGHKREIRSSMRKVCEDHARDYCELHGIELPALVVEQSSAARAEPREAHELHK